MKTAISIPDSVYEQAERYARRKGITRSELYRQALQLYLEREETIVEQLNAVYDKEDSTLDPLLEKLQYRTLTGEDRDEG
jgi:metal-responsive CopG/Arc/MetJ family transcriptional regulator